MLNELAVRTITGGRDREDLSNKQFGYRREKFTVGTLNIEQTIAEKAN